MKRIIVLAGLALLAIPASAQAWSVSNYRVRDAGPEIVHKLVLCTQVQRGYEQKFYFNAYTEHADGSDGGSVNRRDWFSRGCWTYTIIHNDDLEYRGPYRGRVKVRLARTDDIRFTGWRPFWSS